MKAKEIMNGVLEVLADIAQDFGDGAIFPSADSFWLNAAAQIDNCKEAIAASEVKGCS